MPIKRRENFQEMKLFPSFIRIIIRSKLYAANFIWKKITITGKIYT